MRIAIDAMGGDNAPTDIVSGAIQACKVARKRFSIVLVGDENKIKESLATHENIDHLDISIQHASQAVKMSDSPSIALKKKKDSSIAVAMKLHKKGDVDAVVSAGNTGAVLATALISLRKINGVIRPAIGSLFPTEKDVTLLIDAGTNVDCKPLHLLQFGIMGSIFHEKMVGHANPTVGLLSIGEEESKGNEITQRSYKLFKESHLNFIGNVQGGDILRGNVDVIVCDGFVGNIILKFAESFLKIFSFNMKKNIGKNPFSMFGGLLMKPVFNKIKQEFDYAEYGGVPLLGVNGVNIICHGSSSPKAIKNAIFEAEKVINEKVNEHIKQKLQTLSEEKVEL